MKITTSSVMRKSGTKNVPEDDLFRPSEINNITSTKVEATLFTFRGARIRVIPKDEPWFVAKDIAEVLGYSDTERMTRRLDAEDKGKIKSSDLVGLSTRYGNNDLTVINESGLYAAILGSSKPEAKAFKRWVTSEVLPSIRKHGAYLTEQKIEEILTSPDTIIQLATELKVAQEQRRIAEEAHRHAVVQIGILEPKAQLADNFLTSKGNILVRDYAKHVKQALKLPRFGQDLMFKWLKKRGYMNENRYPSQSAVDREFLYVVEGTHYNPVLDIYERHHTTKITPKGQGHFLNLLRAEAKANGGEIVCD